MEDEFSDGGIPVAWNATARNRSPSTATHGDQAGASLSFPEQEQEQEPLLDKGTNPSAPSDLLLVFFFISASDACVHVVCVVKKIPSDLAV
jgi:hypothetical protein